MCLRFIILSTVLFQYLQGQQIEYQIDAILGDAAELPCNVTAEVEGDELSTLAWYNYSSYSGGYSTAFYSRDLRPSEDEDAEISIEVDQERRYQLITDEEEGICSLRIKVVTAADDGIYFCSADFNQSPTLKTYVKLNVIETPQQLWVIHEDGTRIADASVGSNASENIGPYYVGDRVHLVCVAFGGKPAELTWWSGGRPLKNTSTPLSEHRVRSDLEYGPLTREDHGLVLSCTAANTNRTLPLAIDVIVDMYLPPELVSVRDMNTSTDGSQTPGRVHAGQSIRLQCHVLGARPTPDIQWRLNNIPLDVEQTIIREPSQRRVMSEIQYELGAEQDESHITCCAPSNRRDMDAFVCAQAMPLVVYYKPLVEIEADGDLENATITAIKGTDVAFNCSYRANPPVYDISWFHDEKLIADGDELDLEVKVVLYLKNVTEDEAGDYLCAAMNDEGTSNSKPITVDVIYPAYCEDAGLVEYGVSESEVLNLTCNVKSNPKPKSYRWVLYDELMDINNPTLKAHISKETSEDTIQFQRPNGTAFTAIYCWGLNGVTENSLPHTPCKFLVTDERVPHPPTDCQAEKGALGEINIQCEAGHDGGMPQKFKFNVYSKDTDEELVSITSLEPNFIIQEPKEDYRVVIIAFNEKGESDSVEIERDSIIDNNQENLTPKSAVSDLTTLTLSLCGGVLLIALAACGLVLCANDRGSRHDIPRAISDPPLCAYNTDESNCETYHDSEDGSDCNVRRTESFRRAMSRYPSSKNYDVRRTSSFHSTRYINDMPDHDTPKCSDILRHTGSCRVHSLQNISRKREMEAACDHLIMHLPPETNYQIAKPMNTFYTMPRKVRSKKHISDDASEITQTSDGFSLPPPPDEFGTYRAASRIKDLPTKSAPTYTTVKKMPKPYNTQMNTVGLPTISGTQNSIYSYPDDHQATLTSTGFFTTFQSNSSLKNTSV